MTSASRSTEPADAQQATELLEWAFAQWQGELLGTLYYIVGNHEDARDALQETFLKCWTNAESVVAADNLKAWIFRVALNTGRDLRKTAWRRRRQALPGDEAMLPTTEAGPEQRLDQDEQVTRVRAALIELRPEEQEVFLLGQNGEMTYEQIGKAMDIPTGTAKTRMRLALKKLREALVEE